MQAARNKQQHAQMMVDAVTAAAMPVRKSHMFPRACVRPGIFIEFPMWQLVGIIISNFW